MSVTVTLAGVDHTSDIDRNGLQVQQLLGAQRDTATLIYKKYGSKSYTPAVLDTVLIQDGATKIFGGRIATIQQTNLNNASGTVYQLDCVDYSLDLDSELVSQQYVGKTISEIITDFVTNFATGFTATNVVGSTIVANIVFNQVPISQAIKKLADLVKYDWYVDPDKDIHFFPKYTALAPITLTDTSGNYVNASLHTSSDGTQIANQIKVRGGSYVGNAYSDSITVKGNDSKSFKLPYQFNSLTVSVNSVSKTVGVDFLDSFPSYDVLYNFQQWTILFENELSDGDIITFSGFPYIPVLAITSDATSIAAYGVREKLIEDKAINDLQVARQRALAELAAYKDPLQTAKFETYTAGLRSGQTITINSARRSINTDYLIRSVTFQMRTPTEFLYSVELVTIKTFTLIEVLQSLLQPSQESIDPNEQSEIIKTDLATVTITESITKTTTPDHTHTATVTVSEVIAHDPLGAHVAPTWVLGPYIPASTADTKRVINLDRTPADIY